MTLNSNSLLPNGLTDLLPPQAEKEAHIIHLLMQNFSNFGYQRVKPPLVEFEESLLADGPGSALARNTFRLMDPVSQRMMGVRADTTAQIARIAKSRLGEEPRPLRLSYAADVLKVNGSQLRPQRQFCQVGCEMIGGDTPQNDVEVCLTALSSLQKIDVADVTVDLTIPTLIDALFDGFNLEIEHRGALNRLLQKRDRDGLEALKKDINADLIAYLVAYLDASGVAQEAIEKLKNIEAPKQVEPLIVRLIKVYEGLKEALDAYQLNNIGITIDLIERRGFDYQDGISFTLFSPHVRGELGRGGRYNLFNDVDKNASGFTLYMDSVLAATSKVLEEKKKNVSQNCSWNEIKELQDAGYQVSRIDDE